MKLRPRMITFARARDGAGQFAPQAGSGGSGGAGSGGANPATMAAAYPGTSQNTAMRGKAATGIATAVGTTATALMIARKLRAARR